MPIQTWDEAVAYLTPERGREIVTASDGADELAGRVVRAYARATVEFNSGTLAALLAALNAYQLGIDNIVQS